MQLLNTALISGVLLGCQVACLDESPVKKNATPESYIHLTFDKLRGSSYDDAGKDKKASVHLRKRDDGYEEIEIKNELSFYSVEMDIGTPSQAVHVLLDTGSSDLWVSSPENPYCEASNDAKPVTSLSTTTLSGSGTATSGSSSSIATVDCSEYGTFDSSKSETFNSNGTAFSISYGDGTFASGTWSTDNINMGDVNVTNLSFAVANASNSTVGVLGIGLPGLQSTYVGSSAGSQPYQYDNLPMAMKSQGIINRNAYSLFLNDQDATTGSVLFGAVDHSKYSGSLYTIPILNMYRSRGYQNPIEFDVTVQGVSVTSGSTAKNLTNVQFPALLDSGTTLSYLPYSLTELIANAVGATYSRLTGYYSMRCPSANNDTKILFDFGGFQIAANLSSYLLSTSSSSSTCYLGMIPLSSNSAIFGDNFLINTYVVYDLENYEISMAQAAFNNGESDIEVISDSVPSATRAQGYSSTWSTNQPIGSATGTATGIGTARVSGTSTSTRSTSRTNGGSDFKAPSALYLLFATLLSFFI